MPTYESTRSGYANLWRKAYLRGVRIAAAHRVARRIVRERERYDVVAEQTGVPWVWLGAVHDRESGGDFRGVLHNGEHVIGTGRKTSLVPAGRGPFASWEEAAIDAVRLKKLHEIRAWPVERMLYEAERFNGFGYFARGVNSPYVWAGTNLQERGKYVADGVWDESAWDRQLGVAAVFVALAAIDADAAALLAQEPAVAPQPGPSPAPAPVPVPSSLDRTIADIAAAVRPILEKAMQTEIERLQDELALIRAKLNAKTDAVPDRIAPRASAVLSPIDRLLGGQAFAGYKTLTALLGLASTWFAGKTGALETSMVYDALVAVFIVLGGAGFLAKIDRALGAIASWTGIVQRAADFVRDEAPKLSDAIRRQSGGG